MSIWWGQVKKSQETESSPSHPVKHHCYVELHLKIRKSIFLRGLSNTGTGCPEWVWRLHPWRCSKPDWTPSWATPCRWPWSKWTVGPDGPQRCPPSPTMSCGPLKGILDFALHIPWSPVSWTLLSIFLGPQFLTMVLKSSTSEGSESYSTLLF